MKISGATLDAHETAKIAKISEKRQQIPSTPPQEVQIDSADVLKIAWQLFAYFELRNCPVRGESHLLPWEPPSISFGDNC